MSFDITLAFDKAEYLNQQIYLFGSSIKGKIPEDTVVHIVTNRDKNDDALQYLKDSIDSTLCVIYKEDNYPDLQSRCKYMLNCFKIHSSADWIIKLELDFIFLKHLNEFNKILTNDVDCVLEPENRKIFDDNSANKLWRIIYRAMGYHPPAFKIQYRENKEEGLPLFGTGLICVRNWMIDKINEKWIPLTKICERWIDLNIHPNEMAFTGLILNSGCKWKLYDDKYKFNPIGHYRKGQFPSTNLIDNCVLPDDTIILDYHRPQWLMHVAKYNPQISDIICKNSKYIPDDWWNLDNNQFQEHA